jgi:hypothetical protein
MAMDPERARRLRRRLWALAFFLAIGVLVWQTFDKTHEVIGSTLVLELGTKAEQVQRVEADLFVGDESAGSFAKDHRPGTAMGNPRFTARFPGANARAVIRIYLPDRIVSVERKLVAERNATIYIPLAAEIP